MKYFFSSIFFFSVLFANAQSPIGVWKTKSDLTGIEQSHIEIFEKDGKLLGKVVKLLVDPEDTLCTACKGELKNQPVMGMVLIYDIIPYKYYWSYGKVIDPESGKTYDCNISINEEGNLELRGYISLPIFGRTQIWERVK